MEKSEFKRLVLDIFTYYGRKLPEAVQVDQMAKKMLTVPGTNEITSYIYNEFTDNEDSPLGNLPKKLKSYWFQWQNLNRYKMEIKTTPCDACDGSGMIIFYQQVHELIYRKSAVCGECDNWQNTFARNHDIPVMTRNSLRAAGLALEPQAPPAKGGRAVNDMIGAIGQEIPF